MEAYHREADELKTHYEARGVLSVVDAGRPMAEVTEEILEALGHPENPRFYETSARS